MALPRVPNGQDGIRVINAGRNRIGSTTELAAGNLISGNGGAGISLSQTGVTGSLIYGNLIGTTASGLSALGNSGAGVLLFSWRNQCSKLEVPTPFREM